jgi:hypothetical protein
MGFQDTLQKFGYAIHAGIAAVQTALPLLASAAFRVLLLILFFRYLFAFSHEAGFVWGFAGIVLCVTTVILGIATVVVFLTSAITGWKKPSGQIPRGILLFLSAGLAPLLFTGLVSTWSLYVFHDWFLKSSGECAKTIFTWVSQL